LYYATMSERRQLWAAAKVSGVSRREVAARPFPETDSERGVDRLKKWMNATAYADGTPGDKAIRAAIAALSKPPAISLRGEPPQ